MAEYKIKQVEHDGIIAPPSPIIRSIDGKINVESIVSINQTLAAVVKKINHGLSVGTAQAGSGVGNFRNQWLVFVSPSVADEEFELPHGLKRTPIGFTTWFIDAAGIIYVSRYGSWNKERIFLKCSAGSASCVIELA